ncbi:MAG: helicase-exonuclease AddAB subunit AddA [Acetatifactor sp.]
MAVNFTREQQRVIDTRDCSVLVSAAAGSGKTAVLTERIAGLVCDEEHPIDIDRLLVVTFTNAAAAEMRERVAARIAEKLEECPDSEHIQRQATLLHNAQITTIDSFCLYLLRNHFNEIGLDPAFRIADEGEIKLMRQDVMAEMLEECFASGDEEFQNCVEVFCPGGKESVLEKYILMLSGYAAAFPWPGEWLEERKSDYEADTVEAICHSDYCSYLDSYLHSMVKGLAEKMKQVLQLCEEPDGPYMYGEMVEGELEQLERLKSCANLREFAERLPAVSFGRLSGKKDESVSSIKRQRAADLRAEVKKSLQGMAEKYFATPLELAAEQGKACCRPVTTLVNLTLEFDRRMQAAKQEKKVIDFSDMEHYALDILLKKTEEGIFPSHVALEYRQHFAEILIDEYQDSNLVQEYLLAAVSGEEDGHFNRFMVGDVKQSIYRFRLARPELFLEKYENYGEQGSRVRIDLSRNFRSRRQVTDAVNDVFSALMSKETGGIVYDEKAALYPGASYPEQEGNESELLLVERPEKESEFTGKQLEAKAIAARIKELRKDFLVTDKGSGSLRPVRYSDMVILLRTNSGWDEEFKEVLEEEGIPVFITTKSGYFSATEVQELLQLLRVLDNPEQDIPLFGVMKSIFGGFTEEEIAAIRSAHREDSLYRAVKLYGDSRTEEFVSMLEQYRRCTIYMSVRELLTKLVTDFNYLNYVTALPAGGKRRANVEMLFTRASEFEKSSYFGLFHFIRYMEQLEKYDVDYGEADTLDENADVVRIMSIHKSKGLEFPVAFVAGLGKKFNLQDTNQSLILDMDFGLGTDYVDPGRRFKNKTIRRKVLATKLRQDNLAEEMRVLYVAMTRAREKLILTATLDNAVESWEQYRENSQEQLAFSDFAEAGSYLDFLLPVAGRTCLQVSVLGEADLLTEELKEQFELGDRKRKLEEEAAHPDPALLAQLKERLGSVYPHQNLEGLYTKTTVSELKIAAMADKDEAAFHCFEEKEVEAYIPTFRRGEEKISGTVRGNAYHRVMEILDLSGIYTDTCRDDGTDISGMLCQQPQGQRDVQELSGAQELPDPESMTQRVESILQEAVKSGRLKKEYFEAVNLKKLVHFLQSELALRMWKADWQGKLYREQPFVLGISANRLNEAYPKTENVLIQGIIDVFFEEEDGLVLLDYKTDAVASMEELWNRYESQLDYYSEALQRIMGKPVKERILYSFHLEKAYSL